MRPAVSLMPSGDRAKGGLGVCTTGAGGSARSGVDGGATGGGSVAPVRNAGGLRLPSSAGVFGLARFPVIVCVD